MPKSIAGLAGTPVGTLGYFAGGGTDFQAFDTVSGLWSSLPNMPTERLSPAAVSVGNICYFAGGGSSAAFEAYKITGDDYPAETLAIEITYGLTQNLARLAKDKLVDMVLAIRNVYWHDGAKLVRMSAKTNVDNAGWKSI